MNRNVLHFGVIALALIIATASSPNSFAGGKSKSCKNCGSEKHVKHELRLVKVSEEVDVPSYVYSKEEVFYPDKGAVCYTGFRSDTFYDFWRSCECLKESEPSQQATQRHISHLNCSSYTVCGCKTIYGAKATGCHSGCSIRVPGKSKRTTTPILKWETISLCKDCCEQSKKK